MLSPSEAEELIEHLQGRPDIWLEHQGMWVRKILPPRCLACGNSGFLLHDIGPNQQGEVCGECPQGPEYGVAVKLKNSMPGGMYALTVKPISWQRDTACEYVDWLLEKYTAYPLRQQFVRLIEKSLKPGEDPQVLSKLLAELQGGPFLRKRMR